MGFTHFWRFLNQGDGKAANVLIGDKSTWLVFDWNNVVLKMNEPSGGHIVLLYDRMSTFFETLVISGFRICIIRDGNHGIDKGFIKLQRQLVDLSKKVQSGLQLDSQCSAESIDSDLMLGLAFAVGESTLKGLKDVVWTDVVNHQTAHFIDHTAAGEADPVIRQFIRDRTSNNEKVIILSEDASLIVGIDNLDLVQIMNPAHCSIVKIEGVNRICGHLFNPTVFLKYLSDQGDMKMRQNDLLHPLQPPLMAKDLAWIVIFFETEILEPLEHYTKSMNGSDVVITVTPFSLVLCMDHYLNGYVPMPDNSNNQKLVSVSLFVRRIAPLLPDRTGNIDASKVFVPVILNIANAMTEVTAIDGMPMPSGSFNKLPKMSVLRIKPQILADKLVARWRRVCDLDEVINDMKVSYGEWVTHEQHTANQDTQYLMGPLTSLVNQVRMFRKLLKRGDPYIASEQDVWKHHDHIEFNTWMSKHKEVQEQVIRTYATAKRNTGSVLSTDLVFTSTEILSHHIVSTRRSVIPSTGVLIDKAYNTLGLHWHHSNADDVMLSENMKCHAHFKYNTKSSSLLNISHRVSMFNQLFTDPMGEIGMQVNVSADMVFELFGLRTDFERHAIAICDFWHAIGLTEPHLSVSAAKNLLSIAYAYFTLCKDSRIVQSRTGNGVNLQQFVETVIESLILSPVFARGVKVYVDEEDLWYQSPNRFREAIKKYHSQLHHIIGGHVGSRADEHVAALLDRVVRLVRDLSDTGYDDFKWYDLTGVVSSLRLSHVNKHVYEVSALMDMLKFEIIKEVEWSEKVEMFKTLVSGVSQTLLSVLI